MQTQNEVIEKYHRWAIGTGPCPYPKKKLNILASAAPAPMKRKRLTSLQIKNMLEEKIEKIRNNKS